MSIHTPDTKADILVFQSRRGIHFQICVIKNGDLEAGGDHHLVMPPLEVFSSNCFRVIKNGDRDAKGRVSAQHLRIGPGGA